MQPLSLRSYLERSLLKQSLVGLILMALVSLVVSFFVAKYKASSDLQGIARSTSKAYRSHILDGDIKNTEMQIHELLQLKSKEQSLVLDKDFNRIYKLDRSLENVLIEKCAAIGEVCFQSLTGPAQITYPIYFDEQAQNLFGYLYISKNVRIDWIFVGIVFSIFAFGYLVLFFSINQITQNELSALASGIEDWAQNLQNNPKNLNLKRAVPFSELLPLQKSIEGLNQKIEQFENEASHKAKLNLLRGIAHDILTPVSQLQMNFAALEMKIENDKDSKAILADISDSLNRTAAIAQQVKQLNSNSEKIEICDLSKMVANELTSLKSIDDVVRKNITITSFLSNDLLFSDLTQAEVSRILLNIVQNAAQASDPFSEIEIFTELKDDTIILQVTDSGCGIPFKLQQLVFEPDFTTKPSTGTGLGLSVVRHIVEQHKGNIILESSEGNGTKIRLELPLIKDTHHQQGGSHVLQTVNG